MFPRVYQERKAHRDLGAPLENLDHKVFLVLMVCRELQDLKVNMEIPGREEKEVILDHR